MQAIACCSHKFFGVNILPASPGNLSQLLNSLAGHTVTTMHNSQDPGTLPISIFGDSGASEFSYHDNLGVAASLRATETDAFLDKGYVVRIGSNE